MKSLLGGLVGRLPTPKAEAPVPYVGRAGRASWAGLLGGGDSTNRESQMSTMASNGTLFAIVNRTSNATAAVNWRLYRRVRGGRPEDRVEVTSHAAIDILRTPNAYFTRQELIETCQQHLDLTGEAYLVVARDPRLRSLPLELWPVRPDRMEPVPSPQEYLVGWEYVSPDGERVPLQLDEVIQLRMPNPLDPYRGMGPVQSILTNLDSARYSAEWNRNFFLNSAEPGGIVEVDRRLQDDEFDEMCQRWRDQHQGVANAHRVAILEQGKWIDRKYTNRDMQFAELDGISKATIRESFGIPKFAIGDLDDVNRATAEAARVWFAEQLTVPRLERWKGALNNDLLPLFGPTAEGLEWDYDSPVPMDAEAERQDITIRATASREYIETGWEPESVKTALGLPDALVWQGSPQQAKPALPADPAALRVDSWVDLTAGLLPHQHPHPHAITAAVEVPPELARVQEDWVAALDQLESDWAGGELEQREWILQELEAALAAGGVAALVASLLALVPSMTSSQADLLAASMASLAGTASGRVVEEAAAQDVIVSAVVLTSATFAAAATATATLAAARMAVSAAGEATRLLGYGRTTAEVVADVRTHLEGLSTAPRRAALGGALTWAQNQARIETVRHAPVARYFATEILDSNTCSPCRHIDGEELPTLDAVNLAYGGGGYLMCEGTVRCRGTFRVVWARRDEQGD